MRSFDPSNAVGISTTIPIEALMAAGLTPVDLNNVFINAPDPEELLAAAEAGGITGGVCAWIKGVFGAARKTGIRRLVVCTEGDCSDAHALAEVWRHDGLETVFFGYPPARDGRELTRRITELCRTFGTGIGNAEGVREKLAPLRRRLAELDRLTWESFQTTGKENFTWLVAASDFNSDVEQFDRELGAFLTTAKTRPSREPGLKIGMLGVPPVIDGIFETVEAAGARVIFNEYPREFAMIRPADSLVEQYREYTYPYDIGHRLKNIRREIERRKLDGIINYVQTFCHRAILNRVVKDELPVPMLTIEGDRPGPIGGHTITRIESFIEMLASRKR